MGFPGGSVVKNPPTRQEMGVRSLGWEDPLEKGIVTHSGILAWEIPEEPGGLQSMGLQRAGYVWASKQYFNTKYSSFHHQKKKSLVVFAIWLSMKKKLISTRKAQSSPPSLLRPLPHPLSTPPHPPPHQSLVFSPSVSLNSVLQIRSSISFF